jgi:shikimate kinase
MACGKTTIGKVVAEQTGYDFVDLDQWIESDEGKTVSQFFVEQGEDVFRHLEHKYLLKTCSLKNTIVSTGGGVPCFHNNMELMNNAGKTIYLKFSPEDLKIRIQQSSQNSRPLVAGKNDNEILQFVRESLAKREQYYQQATFTVSGNDEEIAKQIIEFVNAK